MEYKYNYSFIIPHHNLPELLKRCVSSIPKRDDVQIIIIDDNSDPAVVDFGNFPYYGEDNIIIIFDKSGKRQGHARNIGIDRAEGKWLIFADSDDFFFYSINQALDNSINKDEDIIYFKATILDNETYLPIKHKECLPNTSVNKYLNGDKDGEHYVRFRYPAPWGKFIKSSLVKEHNIRFAEIERLEDEQFSYQCGYYANKICVQNYSIYCYIKRENTVTTQITLKSAYTLVRVCADYICFLYNKGLANTPVCRIMTDILFDNLAKMKRDNNKYYQYSLKYLIELGISTELIKSNMKRMYYINIKTRISQILNRIFHI